MLIKAHRYLTDLGLKENEAQVYLACLQKPMGLFVHEIVSITSLRRSSVDLILDRLRKQGFISRHKQGARWVFCAESPEKISHSIHDKVSEFNAFIPTLISMVEQGHMPNVRFYEGIKGVESVFEDIVLTGKLLKGEENELLTISSGKDLIKLLPNHHRHFIQKRIRNGIPTRLLAPKNAISKAVYKTNNTHLRETRYFDEETYAFKTEIDIYGNKVALINLTEPGIMATVIKSSTIASSMRSVFNMLWAHNQS